MANTPLILELPPEVVVHISDFLTTKELGDFRLSCKAVETAIFKTFSKEFFTKRQFMLEQVSLQALIDISKHPVLAKQLSEVIISTHRLRKEYNGVNRLSSALVESGHVDQDVLITTGLARDMLVEAFSNLPNLRTVGLRDFDGLGRLRDGIDARWRTYGWSFGGSDLAFYQLENQPPDAILPLMLLALGQARAATQAARSTLQQSAIPQKQADDSQEACHVAHVDVILRRHHKLMPRSFEVVGGHMGAIVKPVLAGITRLLLTIDNDEHYRLVDVASNPPRRDALANLLHYCPQLEVLRLNFSRVDQYSDRFLQWFGAEGQIADAGEFGTIAPLSLPALKTLDLGMLTASPSALIRTICKYDLTSVNLWKVTIVGARTHPASLKGFLEDLAEELPTSTAIRNMSFGFMCEFGMADAQQIAAYPVRFVKDGNADKHPGDNADDKAVFRSGYGSRLAQWLRDVAERVSILKPDDTYISDDDSSTGDEDSDIEELDDGIDTADLVLVAEDSD